MKIPLNFIVPIMMKMFNKKMLYLKLYKLYLYNKRVVKKVFL